jgi:hypothetical protein
MAQSIQQIQDEIIAAKEAQPVLDVLTSTSKVSIWRLFTYVFAASAWTLQKKHDMGKAEVLDIIAKLKPHKPRWYEETALAFQYGHILLPDSDVYDNSALSDVQIETARVVKFAAAEEIYDTEDNLKGIRIKLATISGGDLAPLTEDQLTSFKAYIKRVKDAGVKIYASTGAADSLKVEITVYYDPLVLDATGQRLDGTNNTPVQDALDNFLLTGLVFNGTFIVGKMIDALQAVEGVVIPHVENVQARYGIIPYADIEVLYKPDSGYLRIIDPITDLIINWEAYHA